MTKILELLLGFLLAIVLPTKIYIFLIIFFILVNLFLTMVIKFNPLGIVKVKQHKYLRKSVKDIFLPVILSTGIYCFTIVGFYWLDIHILNDALTGIFPNINLLSTKVIVIIFLTPEAFALNYNIKILTGDSIDSRFKKFTNIIFKLKDVITKVKKED